MPNGVERKLTTILAADAAGYSTAMQRDEVAAFEALQAARAVFAKLIERHRGRIANTAGDGLIAEFPSTAEAVQFTRDRYERLLVRGAVIAAMLALINLATWSGTPWVVWPAGALAAAALLRWGFVAARS